VQETEEHPARWLNVGRCHYVCRCRAARCLLRATLVLRKAEANGRPLGQVELCDAHTGVVVAQEARRGLGVTDRR